MKHYTANAGLPHTFLNKLRARLVEIFALPFPPSSTDTRILLSDWSLYQGDVDIGKHLAYGPPFFEGVVIRSGQGKNVAYDDTQFVNSVHKCDANNFPWMIYHVLLPNQDVPAQIGRLYDILNKVEKLPRWIWWDVQLVNGQTKRTISNKTIEAIELTKRDLMKDVGVYSAKWFTAGYMETQDWFAEIIWWIAQWLNAEQGLEHPWPTALPATVDISQVMIHQTTSHGDGKLCGVSSTRLDLDRWMWSEERFNEIMGTTTPPPPPDDHMMIWEAINANAKNIQKLVEWVSSF